MRYFIVTTMTEANELLDKGFKILKIDRNKFDRSKCIFLFEPTQELLNYKRKD